MEVIMEEKQKIIRKLMEYADEIAKIQNYRKRALAAGNNFDAMLFKEKEEALAAKQAELQQLYNATYASADTPADIDISNN